MKIILQFLIQFLIHLSEKKIKNIKIILQFLIQRKLKNIFKLSKHNCVVTKFYY